MVSGNGIVCDVGTDHAYLPAYLIENNICDYAIASDTISGISFLPCETAPFDDPYFCSTTFL